MHVSPFSSQLALFWRRGVIVHENPWLRNYLFFRQILIGNEGKSDRLLKTEQGVEIADQKDVCDF